jgi:hypothetical protein
VTRTDVEIISQTNSKGQTLYQSRWQEDGEWRFGYLRKVIGGRLEKVVWFKNMEDAAFAAKSVRREGTGTEEFRARRDK